jgi:DNA (cytosine-5)-methyltransferase 1
LGGKLLGWRTVCAVELDAYCRSVLLARQRDGCLDRFPVWDDVRTFDGKPWRGHVDVVSGGFPCQDISSANAKKLGLVGVRSGLWSEMARVIREVRPQFAFVENVPALIHRGLGSVLGDLAALGYDAEWTVLGSEDVALPMRRDRLWIVAANDEGRREGQGLSRQAIGEVLACSAGTNLRVPWATDPVSRDGESVPRLLRDANGVAHRVERIGAIGNGQVPAVAALAWRLLRGSAIA